MAALAAAVLGHEDGGGGRGGRVKVTAISAAGGESTLECWQLDNAVQTPAGAGGPSALLLGDFAGASYTLLPAGFDGGLHNAPSRQ